MPRHLLQDMTARITGRPSVPVRELVDMDGKRVLLTFHRAYETVKVGSTFYLTGTYTYV